MKEPILPGLKMSPSNFNESLRVLAEKKMALGQIAALHANADGSPLYVNRLVLESSPYLLQHACNPINWHSWGEEAFNKARTLGRPILLSIGYSTCHWCHVMEAESFEDLQIAQFLNENYIAIKVDREERPDLDAIYMTAVQVLTGHGGWPMTVFLTPEAKPFYGGTYFPARDGERGVKTGFLTLLRSITNAYQNKLQQVNLSSQELCREISRRLSSHHDPLADKPDLDVLNQATKNIHSVFDPNNGGVKGAPKFPSSFPLRYILLQAHQIPEPNLKNMAIFTLKKMAHGGIYDQVGGGFHRYSTDAQWQIPHFEKMLYDNALLISTYVEAYQLTHDPEFAKIIRETIDFIARDMTSPEGMFYSALDADSVAPNGHKDEGYFYTWTLDEIQEVLGPDRAALIADIFQVGLGAEHEGRSILHLKESIPPELQSLVDESRILLEKARGRRAKPSRDEKILTSWNGLMISALAKAGFVLSQPDFINRAESAANMLLTKICQNNQLRHSYKDGHISSFGFLDDYAFLTAALLDLYQVTQEPAWLNKAIDLEKTLSINFEDHNNGGFFMTSVQHERLLAREKPSRDGAEPSGNSVAIMNLLRLYELTLEQSYKTRADQALKAFSQILLQEPLSVSELLLAVFYDLYPVKVIVIIAPTNKISQAQPFIKLLQRKFMPQHALVVVEEGEKLEALSLIMPFLKNKKAHENQAVAYVCEMGSCQLPTADIKVFEKQLLEIGPK